MRSETIAKSDIPVIDSPSSRLVRSSSLTSEAGSTDTVSRVKMLVNDSAKIGLLSANWNAPSHWF